MKPTLGRIVQVFLETRHAATVGFGPDAIGFWHAGIVVNDGESFSVQVFSRYLASSLFLPLDIADEGKTWRWPPRAEGPTMDTWDDVKRESLKGR